MREKVQHQSYCDLNRQVCPDSEQEKPTGITNGKYVQNHI